MNVSALSNNSSAESQSFTSEDENLTIWSDNETALFLSIWRRPDVQTALRQYTRKRPIWKKVSSELANEGYRRNAEQCKSKMHNLMTSYRRVKKGLDSETRCKFFPLIDEVMTSSEFERPSPTAPAVTAAAAAAAGGGSSSSAVASGDFSFSSSSAASHLSGRTHPAALSEDAAAAASAAAGGGSGGDDSVERHSCSLEMDERESAAGDRGETERFCASPEASAQSEASSGSHSSSQFLSMVPWRLAAAARAGTQQQQQQQQRQLRQSVESGTAIPNAAAAAAAVAAINRSDRQTSTDCSQHPFRKRYCNWYSGDGGGELAPRQDHPSSEEVSPDTADSGTSQCSVSATLVRNTTSSGGASGCGGGGAVSAALALVDSPAVAAAAAFAHEPRDLRVCSRASPLPVAPSAAALHHAGHTRSPLSPAVSAAHSTSLRSGVYAMEARRLLAERARRLLGVMPAATAQMALHQPLDAAAAAAAMSNGWDETVQHAGSGGDTGAHIEHTLSDADPSLPSILHQLGTTAPSIGRYAGAHAGVNGGAHAAGGANGGANFNPMPSLSRMEGLLQEMVDLQRAFILSEERRRREQVEREEAWQQQNREFLLRLAHSLRNNH